MKQIITGFVLASLALLAGCATPLEPAQKEMALTVAERVMLREQVWGSYTLDLALEAMLEFDRVADCPELREYALGIVEQRNWTENPPAYTGQPFCHLNYKAYIPSFISESERYRNEVTRSPEGAIAHYADQPGRHLLIDHLQDYASRMARTGKLTGDKSYYVE